MMSDITGGAILACFISIGFWLVKLIIAEREIKRLDRMLDILEDMLKQTEKGGNDE